MKLKKQGGPLGPSMEPMMTLEYDLSQVPYEALLAEIRARKPRSLERSCECGKCTLCRKRANVAAHRERKRLAALQGLG